MFLYRMYKYIEYTTKIGHHRLCIATKFLIQDFKSAISQVIYLRNVGNGSNQNPKKKIEAQVKITQYCYDTVHLRHKGHKMKNNMALITNFCETLFNF